MNRIIKCLLLTIFTCAFSHCLQAQEVTKETFTREFRGLMDDAAHGFPKTVGYVEFNDYYGKTYESNTNLFGMPKGATLYYQYPHAYTHTSPVNEKYYFTQSFKDSAEGKFAVANAEAFLDEIAKEQGLKKVSIKQEKEYRKKYREFEYKNHGTSIFGITYYLETGSISLSVFSPYRPQDVKAEKLLGCMAFYVRTTFLYVVPIYGDALGDKAEVARAAYEKSGISEKDYKYEWFPGENLQDIKRRFEKSMQPINMNPYTVK